MSLGVGTGMRTRSGTATGRNPSVQVLGGAHRSPACSSSSFNFADCEGECSSHTVAVLPVSGWTQGSPHTRRHSAAAADVTVAALSSATAAGLAAGPISAMSLSDSASTAPSARSSVLAAVAPTGSGVSSIASRSPVASLGVGLGIGSTGTGSLGFSLALAGSGAGAGAGGGGGHPRRASITHSVRSAADAMLADAMLADARASSSASGSASSSASGSATVATSGSQRGSMIHARVPVGAESSSVSSYAAKGERGGGGGSLARSLEVDSDGDVDVPVVLRANRHHWDWDGITTGSLAHSVPRVGLGVGLGVGTASHSATVGSVAASASTESPQEAPRIPRGSGSDPRSGVGSCSSSSPSPSASYISTPPTRTGQWLGTGTTSSAGAGHRPTHASQAARASVASTGRFGLRFGPSTSPGMPSLNLSSRDRDGDRDKDRDSPSGGCCDIGYVAGARAVSHDYAVASVAGQHDDNGPGSAFFVRRHPLHDEVAGTSSSAGGSVSRPGLPRQTA